MWKQRYLVRLYTGNLLNIYKQEKPPSSWPKKKIEDITLDDIFNAVNREDLLAIELVEQIGQQLGFHIGSLINIFNPDMVIIGGQMSRAGDFLLQPVISAVRKYTLSLMSRDSEIVLSKLKDQACVIGSCLLSRSKLFED